MDDEDFFAVPVQEDVPPEIVVKKKRKRSGCGEDVGELKKKARLLTRCSQEWKSVSRYSAKRLEEYILEREYDNESNLHESIFGFVHKLMALVLDTVTRANGHVQQEIENDISLRQAIEQEGSSFAGYLTNKYKILALTGIDTFNGKKNQRAQEPQIIDITEHEHSEVAAIDVGEHVQTDGEQKEI
jgi:hypothetical protein